MGTRIQRKTQLQAIAAILGEEVTEQSIDAFFARFANSEKFKSRFLSQLIEHGSENYKKVDIEVIEKLAKEIFDQQEQEGVYALDEARDALSAKLSELQPKPRDRSKDVDKDEDKEEDTVSIEEGEIDVESLVRFGLDYYKQASRETLEGIAKEIVQRHYEWPEEVPNYEIACKLFLEELYKEHPDLKAISDKSVNLIPFNDKGEVKETEEEVDALVEKNEELTEEALDTSEKDVAKIDIADFSSFKTKLKNRIDSYEDEGFFFKDFFKAFIPPDLLRGIFKVGMEQNPKTKEWRYSEQWFTANLESTDPLVSKFCSALLTAVSNSIKFSPLGFQIMTISGRRNFDEAAKDLMTSVLYGISVSEPLTSTEDVSIRIKNMLNDPEQKDQAIAELFKYEKAAGDPILAGMEPDAFEMFVPKVLNEGLETDAKRVLAKVDMSNQKIEKDLKEEGFSEQALPAEKQRRLSQISAILAEELGIEGGKNLAKWNALSEEDKLKSIKIKRAMRVLNLPYEKVQQWLIKPDEEKEAYLRRRYKEQRARLGESKEKAIPLSRTSLVAKLEDFARTPKVGICPDCKASFWSYGQPLLPNCSPAVYSNFLGIELEGKDEQVRKEKMSNLTNSLGQFKTNPFRVATRLIFNDELGHHECCGALTENAVKDLSTFAKILLAADAECESEKLGLSEKSKISKIGISSKRYTYNPSLPKDQIRANPNEVIQVTLPDLSKTSAEQIMKVSEALRVAIETGTKYKGENIEYGQKVYSIPRESDSGNSWAILRKYFCPKSRYDDNFKKNAKTIYNELTIASTRGLLTQLKRPTSELVKKTASYPCFNIVSVEDKGKKKMAGCTGSLKFELILKDFGNTKEEKKKKKEYEETQREQLKGRCDKCNFLATYGQAMLALEESNKHKAERNKLKPEVKNVFIRPASSDAPTASEEGEGGSIAKTFEAPPEEDRDIKEIGDILIQKVEDSIKETTFDVKDEDGTALAVHIPAFADRLKELTGMSDSILKLTTALEHHELDSEIGNLALEVGLINPCVICETCGKVHESQVFACKNSLYNKLEKQTISGVRETIEELKSAENYDEIKSHLPDLEELKEKWLSKVKKAQYDLLHLHPLITSGLYPANGILNTKLGGKVYRDLRIRIGQGEDEDEEAFFQRLQEQRKLAPVKPISSTEKKIEEPTKKVEEKAEEPIDSLFSREEEADRFESEFFGEILGLLELKDPKYAKDIQGLNLHVISVGTSPENIEEKDKEAIKEFYRETKEVELPKIAAVVSSGSFVLAKVLNEALNIHEDVARQVMVK